LATLACVIDAVTRQFSRIAVTVLQVSERRACRAIGQIRSSYRYVPRPDHDRARLRERIIALAKAYGRYGYRR
jgi:hypothetical protein